MTEFKIIAIAGGSGSGKTTMAKKIIKNFGPENCMVLAQDSYYIDQSSKFDKDGGSVNFDHPSSLDFSLLRNHIENLKKGEAVQVPIYDFATHKRRAETIELKPHPFILVDGTLILSVPELKGVFCESIFLNIPEDIRYQRRLKRDMEERGRTAEGVFEQFYKQVKPMHDQYVQPSLHEASIVYNLIGIESVKKNESILQTKLMECLI